MANERKTEAIVEKYLTKTGYFTDKNLTVERQQSDSPRINRLLRNASKKGQNRGYPEFIITSKEVSDLLIVIECKAETKKHISKTRDQYADYAVDGVLLYASYLSKEFDVLAIAVSGEKESTPSISHYLHLKGTPQAVDFNSKTILPFGDYHTNYLGNEFKFRQDYNALLNYSRELNENLQAKKIKEAHRGLLICGILVALENAAFKKSYKAQKTAKHLADNLVESILNEFRTAELSSDKISILEQAFAFIRVNSTLISDKDFFVGLIEQIDKNVNSFVRTHKYHDAMGQFYIQFLRYANNDKGLGIVLTPPHIAALFADLAEINKKSVVYDNCCGTSGLLIAAMKRMLEDAGSSKEDEKAIKKSQLIGVEFQDDIYALAVSNMVVHGDGRTNIFQGDCFTLSMYIKERYKPTVGVLNPPYKTKTSTIEELDFVLNNIEVLQPGGRCIAILPFGCAIGETQNILERKKILLEKHTLEAVMSMPVDLFHDSKVGVVTCVMVITAHQPHPKGKKTWFGYWRNDGFVKTKHRGRVDLNNEWSQIKTHWLNGYRGREIIKGLSLMVEINSEDEWCAEAYMKTDYSHLSPAVFEKELKKYVAFRILNEGDDRVN